MITNKYTEYYFETLLSLKKWQHICSGTLAVFLVSFSTLQQKCIFRDKNVCRPCLNPIDCRTTSHQLGKHVTMKCANLNTGIYVWVCGM